ncbi:hypothetical protein [Methanospirillum lacunae]|uniref:Uncharacterized protein n=1 Tax=Methanospirillum lacunae TaxID=668570 RepID=A0A2V2MZG6_9EURY|nr:hypothetical protein [Methanospirillum lacunae]PWR69708.1 hypothetical protein DK846_16950 [Methanospirillum lacunae]
MKWICLFLVLLLIGGVSADRLPSGMPESQIFSIGTTLSATGITDQSTKMDWTVASGTPIENNILNSSDLISLVRYSDSLMGNGGNVIEVKNFEFDSNSLGRSAYNIDSEKILTYKSHDGSHLLGAESLMMNNMGNWSSGSPSIRCVFSDQNEIQLPAFCNIVQAKSDLININQAKISTKGEIRSAGGFSTPAALNYRIAVTADKNVPAQGTVRTEFARSIMEARDTNLSDDTWNRTAATNSWRDRTEASGEIRNLQKRFGYVSGMRA